MKNKASKGAHVLHRLSGAINNQELCICLTLRIGFAKAVHCRKGDCITKNHHNIPLNITTWNSSSISSLYKERIAYDANGNILKYLRDGHSPQAMDSLTYKYNRDANGRLLNNRLEHVRDAVAAGNYTEDIDNQPAGNYTYDKIGNLKTDQAESITGIDWTVYGKIRGMVKPGTGCHVGYHNFYTRISQLNF